MRKLSSDELIYKASLISPEVIIEDEGRVQRRRVLVSFIITISTLLLTYILIYKSTFWLFSSGAEQIFKLIRLPRLVVGFSVGALLSLSGHILQITLENPLAEPYLLGASSGSALMVAIGSLLSLKFTPLLALIGGMLAFALVVLFSQPDMNPYIVVLNGVVISIVLWSLTLALVSVFPKKLSNLFPYFMGTLSGSTLAEAKMSIVITVVALLIAMLKAVDLDLLSLGKSVALTMGVDVKWASWLLLALAIVSVSVSVYYAGIIGFVGLVVPHLFRTLSPLPNKYFIPLLAIGGGTFIVLADWLAYTLLYPREIPVGIACAIIGAPVFLFVFRRMQES